MNRYAEATAENNQRLKQMGLAKNLIVQVRKTCLCLHFLIAELYYKPQDYLQVFDSFSLPGTE